jgi:predicted TIM-barrel fold metal-dependent hydrolase
VYADTLLSPWLDCLLDARPGLDVVDVHNHVGDRDPSGFSASVAELTGSLRRFGGHAVVLPLADPEGYAEANLRCAEAVGGHESLVASFARLTPQDRPADRLAAALAAGGGGVKLHPAGDAFDLADERLEPVLRTADERRLPVLVHAGPELAGIGETALALCREHPGLRMVLAHCGLTDLAWIGRHLSDVPNLFFDTSWWDVATVMALLRTVPPGRVLNAADLPYATPLAGAITALRCAEQAGLDADQVASVAGGQARRLLAGAEPLPDGATASPVVEARPVGPVLAALASALTAALEPLQRGEPPGVPLTVARHLCKVPADHPDADVVASVARLVELFDEHHDRLERRNQFTPGWDLVSTAAIVARTPAAPLPRLD